MIGKEPVSIDGDRHVGQGMIDSLEFDQRPSKCLSLLHVLRGFVERSHHQTEAGGAVVHPLHVECVHQAREFTGTDDDIVLADMDVL